MDISTFQKDGFFQVRLDLPVEVGRFLEDQDYNKLDLYLKRSLEEGGILYNVLQHFCSIHKSEHLIAIRDGQYDEDGIWHDDGSRELAFTLALVRDLEQLDGGVLLFRRKSSPSQVYSIPTAPYGTLTIIKTGQQGYEHRVEKVTRGKRVICAGWIN